MKGPCIVKTYRTNVFDADLYLTFLGLKARFQSFKLVAKYRVTYQRYKCEIRETYTNTLSLQAVNPARSVAACVIGRFVVS